MRRPDRHALWLTAAVMAASLLAATVPVMDARGQPVTGCAPAPAAGKPGCEAAGRCRFTGQLP